MIRRYEPRDAQQVTALVAELQEYERALESDRVAGDTMAECYVADLLRQCAEKQGALFVMLGDDADAREREIAGFVCVWLEREPETYTSTLVQYAYVSDLVVREPHRGRGVGQCLLARAEAHAREVGARVLRVNVLAANGTARQSYQRAGFREYELELLKALE